jgi:hypothetical protein
LTLSINRGRGMKAGWNTGDFMMQSHRLP